MIWISLTTSSLEIGEDVAAMISVICAKNAENQEEKITVISPILNNNAVFHDKNKP